MQLIAHPSAFISAKDVALLRLYAGEAEHLKQLHPVQLAIIYQHNWFRMLVPQEYGGLAYTLPELLFFEEALAWADGSVGWTVTLCAGAGWFCGFLDKDLVNAFFPNPKTCIAGSGTPSGIAKKNGDQYEISGRWQYASGAGIATAFTANCRLEDDQVKSFIFLPKEVIVQENWNSVGLVATGSHSFEVKQLSLPLSRCFQIDACSARLTQPIYQFPFLQLAETTIAVNSAGMAARFMELCVDAITFNRLQESKMQLESIRRRFYQLVISSWDTCSAGRMIDDRVLQNLSHCSKELAHTARRITDELYPYCGLGAADLASEINRVWRNLHTASQHGLMNK
jgi:indole-3-acetate monooxygenase